MQVSLEVIMKINKKANLYINLKVTLKVSLKVSLKPIQEVRLKIDLDITPKHNMKLILIAYKLSWKLA